MDPLIISALIVLCSQLPFAILAILSKKETFTDLSYGLSFGLLAIYFAFLRQTPLAIAFALMVSAWGVRLAFFLFKRVLSSKDPRFEGMRGSIPRFALFWLMQSVTIFLITLPIVLADGPISSVSFIGMGIWVAGFLMESIADAQKRAYKQTHPDHWVDAGLWRYSRHPNYFGEILCWVGIYLCALPALGPWALIALLSPAAITFLLLFVSGIPPLERHMENRYGSQTAYQEYKRQTSLLIPLPLKTKTAIFSRKRES